MLKTAETKIEKIIYSAVIVLAAVAFPLYLLYTNGNISIKVTPTSLFVGVLYIIFISGWVFLVFNKTGPQVTSKETDKKISKAWGKISNILLIIIIAFILFQVAKLIYVYVF